MTQQLTLGVTTTADGGWRLTLSESGATSVQGVVSPEVVQATFTANTSGRPAEVGALLGGALARCPSVLARIYTALGTARERREPTLLLLVCEDGDVLRLPWERCVDPSGTLWEAREPLCIVRRLPGGNGVSAREHAELRLGFWGTAGSLTSAPLLASVCAKLGLPEPLSFTGPVDAALLNAPDTARVLHLQSPVPDDPLPQSLRAALTSVTAVVVHGDQGSWPEAAARLLHAGAPAVLSGVPDDAEAAEVMLERVYRSLLSVAGLAEAVKEARAACPLHGGGVTLAVHDGAALCSGVVRERWAPEGWPRPSGEVGTVLQGALELAQQLASGFVGLEHLVLALCRPSPRGRVAERLRFMLSMRRDGVRERLGSYELSAPENVDYRGTPRLRALSSQLEAGFEVEHLWALIQNDISALVNATTRVSASIGPRAESTLVTGEGESVPRNATPQAAAATRFEVLGGPEDGRLVRLEVGEELGRASADSSVQHTLYEGTALIDRHLSRRQLRWLGDGRVELLARARELRRPGGVEPLHGGTVQINVGDVLALTRVTWLRGAKD
ncbi:hypothetical protein L6R49_14930 [Myxococcota bacterium]|nr:hypothetical protein [Myxococcota bacterium]